MSHVVASLIARSVGTIPDDDAGTIANAAEAKTRRWRDVGSATGPPAAFIAPNEVQN
jgi:hypothetical protein